MPTTLMCKPAILLDRIACRSEGAIQRAAPVLLGGLGHLKANLTLHVRADEC